MDENALFDAVTSGSGQRETASESITNTEPVTTPAASDAGRPTRDESGRFASQQQPQEGAGAATTDQPVTEPQTDAKGVPVAALQAEREKARQAKDEAEALRREIAELRGMVTAQRQQTTTQPAAEQKPEPTIWDAPDEFVKSQLTPIQQEIFNQKVGFSRMLAAKDHGAEAVDAALAAAMAIKGTPEGQILDQRLFASMHPFDDLVQWHKKQQAFARVGDDPDAWLQSELERRLSDPTEQAKILERIRGSVAATPSTSRAPVTNLPPSLSGIPTGGNATPQGDQSDAGLFNSLTSRRR